MMGSEAVREIKPPWGWGGFFGNPEGLRGSGRGLGDLSQGQSFCVCLREWAESQVKHLKQEPENMVYFGLQQFVLRQKGGPWNVEVANHTIFPGSDFAVCLPLDSLSDFLGDLPSLAQRVSIWRLW